MLDLLQNPVDSLANAVGSQLGSTVLGYIIVGLGLANKWVITALLKKFNLVDRVPAWSKATASLILAQLMSFIASNLPLVSVELAPLPVVLTGTMVWLLSMGWHSVLKVVMPKLAKN